MADLKQVLYDWGGANISIFNTINRLADPSYDHFMLIITKLGDKTLFPYYLFAFACFALLQWAYGKIAHKGGSKQMLVEWVGVLVVLCAGFFAMLVVIYFCKDYFAYPRPYIVLGEEHIRHLLQLGVEKDNQSFPSGHAAFITLMVVGLWPVLSYFWSLVGVTLIILICWSRIAIGVHFPADVVGAMLIMLIVTSIVRSVAYNLLSRIFRLHL